MKIPHTMCDNTWCEILKAVERSALCGRGCNEVEICGIKAINS